jgi:hypothetical protein
MMWGNDPYSPEVINYTAAYSLRYELSQDQKELINSKWRSERWEQVRMGVGFAVGGWFALWIAASVVGWIVRGFFGIPAGRDSRPTDPV